MTPKTKNGADMNEEPSMKLTDFDYLTGDHRLQMVKAALPYVNISEQRLLSVMVKFQELRRTISLFDDEETMEMGICSLGDQAPRSPLDMMGAIRPYANPQEQDFIDLVSNFLRGWQAGRSRSGADVQEAVPVEPALPPQDSPQPPQDEKSGPASHGIAPEQFKYFLPPQQQSRLETASLLVQAMRQLS